MAGLRIFRRLMRDHAGAVLIEVVVVAFVFFSMTFAIIEYGMIMLTKIAIESATQQVSRSSGVNKAVGGCTDRACQVSKLVQDKTLGLISPQYVNITSRVVSSPTDASPPIPDTCLDTPGVPSPPACFGYLNNDGVAGYQQPVSVSVAAVGATSDLVEIRVSNLWQVMFPLMKPFFKNGVVVISSSTVVKNEPF
jgi:hypothetical protein